MTSEDSTRQGGRQHGDPKALASGQHKLNVSELAKRYTPEAIKTLATIMRTSESDKTKVSAANSLLDRAFGKPPNSTDVRVFGEVEHNHVLDDDSRCALLRELIDERLENLQQARVVEAQRIPPPEDED